MESEIKELIKLFYSEDGIQRSKARFELANIGKPAIEYLVGLQYSPKQQVRWEAIKTISQIAAPESIPILINALENNDLDVRWIAAEGLIEIGKESIKPLLEALVCDEPSKFILEGAHHVLKSLQFKHLFFDDEGLIEKLEHYHEYSSIAYSAGELLSKYQRHEIKL